MYASQIKRIARNDRLYLRKTLVGIYAKDKLPPPNPPVAGMVRRKRKPLAYIINSATSDSLGEHWLGVFVSGDNKLIWFDPLGKSPAYYGPVINRWLKSWGLGEIVQNSRAVQPPHSRLCGLYVLYVLYHLCRNFSLPYIIDRMFYSRKGMNDFKIKYFFRTRFGFSARRDMVKPGNLTRSEMHKKMKHDLSLILTDEYI